MEIDGIDPEVAELREQLEFERSEKERLQGQLEMVKSESVCAVAWAESASEAVRVLEEQLQNMEGGQGSGGTSQQSIDTLVEQLNQMQLKELEMAKRADDLHNKLNAAYEESDKFREEARQAQEDLERLKIDLKAEKAKTEKLAAQSSQVEEVWFQYKDRIRFLEDELKEAASTPGKEKLWKLEKDKMEDEVHELQQLLADAEAEAIEKRNEAAKWEDEAARLVEQNSGLFAEVKQLRELLAQRDGYKIPTDQLQNQNPPHSFLPQPNGHYQRPAF